MLCALSYSHCWWSIRRSLLSLPLSASNDSFAWLTCSSSRSASSNRALTSCVIWLTLALCSLRSACDSTNRLYSRCAYWFWSSALSCSDDKLSNCTLSILCWDDNTSRLVCKLPVAACSCSIVCLCYLFIVLSSPFSWLDWVSCTVSSSFSRVKSSSCAFSLSRAAIF